MVAFQRLLVRLPVPVFTAYAIGAAFATYFCMYAYRKPFAVGLFEGALDVPLIGEVNTKIVFIIAQVFGYCASKFFGIKIISEMQASRRAIAILIAIGSAEVALLLFAVAPMPLKPFCLFLNGLPLGMVWGLVFAFLEGRKTSDLLGAGLCASFIVSSGFVKTVGRVTMSWGVSEYWMPFVTGLIFALPTVLFVFLLAQVPPPTKEDEELRTARRPMDKQARRKFFGQYAFGLVLLVASYILLTAYRDFRDNFASDLWDALGYADQPAMLTNAELPVAFGSLIAIALVMAVKDNRRALLVIHGLMLMGATLILGSTLLFQAEMLDPATWMVAVGVGLYLGYVPYNFVLFDRLVAAAGFIGTAGFMIYVADAFGYLGSVSLLLYKNFGQPDLSWLSFFEHFSLAAGAITIVLFVISGIYFWRRTA